MRLRNPRVALDKGIAYASENRRTEGLVGNLSVRANIVLAMQSARGWARAIPRRQQAELADKYIKALDIRPTDPEAIVANLSGGNQQKVLLARWLLTAPKLLLLDEPTRGIDVGAKAEIQRLVAALADDGISVLFISAELEEVLRLSHRIVVMRELHKVAELDEPRHDGERSDAHHRRGRRDRRRGGGGTVKAIVTHRLFWPLLILVALLVATRLKSPIFFDIRVRQRQPVRQPHHDPAAHGADAARRPRDDARDLDPRHRPLGRRRGGDRRRRGDDVHRLVGAARRRRHGADRRRHRPAARRCSAARGTGSSSPSLGIQPIIATLVLMTAGRGVAQLITDERIITASSRPYEMIGGGYWLGLPFSILLAGVDPRCSPPC